MASEKKIAVVGLGIMGSAIARNLLERGFAVAGYDIERRRLDELKGNGGTPAASAAEAAREAAIVLTSLPSTAALDATVEALLGLGRRGQIVVELSTFPIDAKEKAARHLAEGGIVALDCPLSGTGAQAATRDLSVYASGDEAAYRDCTDVFEGFARKHYYLGAFGNGSKMKFVANLMVAVHNVASAEAMVLGMKAGLDPKLVSDVVGAGAGTSRIFELRSPMMVAGRYEPATMKIDIWQKDMKVIGEFARSLGVETPTFSASDPVYKAALAEGHGAEDVAAVCAVLEKRAGVKR